VIIESIVGHYSYSTKEGLNIIRCSRKNLIIFKHDTLQETQPKDFEQCHKIYVFINLICQVKLISKERRSSA